MNKNTEIKFVGQPIFSQLLKLIDKTDFYKMVKERNSDYYYKAFKSWTHLTIQKRWVVERSFAWLEKCGRLRKNCERKINSSIQFVVLAFIAILLKRL